MSRRLMLRNASGGGERIYLLKDGVYSPVIGGFEKKGFFSSGGTVTIGSEVYVYAHGASSAATATTILAFDVTDKSTIGMKFVRTAEGNNGMGFVLLSDNVVNSNWSGSFINKTTLTFSVDENGYRIADISQLTGNKYLSFIVNTWGYDSSYSYNVSEIWIE